jgi:hypothetical protein
VDEALDGHVALRRLGAKGQDGGVIDLDDGRRVAFTRAVRFRHAGGN